MAEAPGEPRRPQVAHVPSYSTATALPYPHLERATAGPRAVQRAAGELADRVSLVVTGPVRLSDARGRVWHEYRAEVHPPVAGLGLWPPRRLRRLRRLRR